MTTIRERVVNDSAGYLVKMIAARFILFAGSLFVARVLNPADYGIWKTTQLFLIYSLYAEWGIAEALNREIPFYAGKRDSETVGRIRNAGYAFSWINSLVLAAAGVIALFAAPQIFSKRITDVFLIALAAFVLQQIYQYFEILYRTNNNFKMLSNMRLYRTLSDGIAAVLLAYLMGLSGRVFSYALTYGLVLSAVYLKRDFVLKWSWDWKLTLRLVRAGMPIMLVGLAYTLLTTVDKFMVVKFLGAEAMGYYSIGLMAISFVYLGPMVISEVLYPRICGRYGQTQDIKSLKNIVVEPTIVLAYVFPVLLGFVYLLLPLGVVLILPNYAPGIRSAQFLVMGMFFISLTTSFGNFLNTISQQNINILFQTLFLILAAAVDYFIIKAGGEILAVAAATGVIYLLYMATISGYVYVRFFGGFKEHLKFMLEAVAPIAGCFFLLAVLERVFGAEAAPVARYYINLAAQIAIFAVFSGLLVFAANKKSNIVTCMYTAVKMRFTKT